MSQNQPQTIQQFIDTQKTQYATQKGIQASNEYTVIIQPYIQEINALKKENKELLEKIPKKQRVKITNKKNK